MHLEVHISQKFQKVQMQTEFDAFNLEAQYVENEFEDRIFFCQFHF